MASPAMFAEIASLAGDPSRAAMLHALWDGRALTAAELAEVAGVTPDQGVIPGRDVKAFIAAAKTRQWDREPNVRTLA